MHVVERNVRAQRGWHVQAQHGERLVEALAQAGRRPWVGTIEFFGQGQQGCFGLHC